MSAMITDRQIKQTKAPAVLMDGGGLRLKITQTAAGTESRRWVLRLTGPDGRTRDLGLGAYPDVGLAEARERAAGMRAAARGGAAPVAKRERRQRERTEGLTFRACADAYIAQHEGDWKNPKHRQQWRATLATYAHPVMGDLPVAAITEAHVTAILDPIWREKPETAARVRGRLERILDWARVRGHRTGENPARWRGHMELALPKRQRTQRHHEALAWADMPAFWRTLTTRTGAGADCLRFTILTAVRSGEARGARWREIDMDKALWTIAAERMKAGKEHRVPLNEPALDVLRHRRALAGDPAPGDLVFASDMRDAAMLSDMTLGAVLKRMGRTETVHGFRSTFCDWASERTGYAREVCEAALAHAIPNATEAAYRRGDLFEKRARLMSDWASYVRTPAVEGDNVIPMRGG